MAVQVSAAGFILWLLLWLPAGFSGRAPGQIDRLFLLAPLSIVPLGLALIATPGQRDTLLHRVARLAQPPCALLVLLSFLFRTGVTAALLTLPWLLFGIWCALAGLVRLLPRGLRHTEELCLDFALLYLPVGCVWLFLARCGANPMDFSDDIVLLTAVHFHYAGFAALTMAGMTGRYACGSLYRGAASCAILAIPILALSITFSPALEVVAAIVLATSLVLLAAVTLTVLPLIRNPGARLRIAVSAVSLIAAMILAASRSVGGPPRRGATGKFTRREWIDIPQMA